MGKIVKVSNDYFIHCGKKHLYFKYVEGKRFKNPFGLETFRELDYTSKAGKRFYKSNITEATTGL